MNDMPKAVSGQKFSDAMDKFEDWCNYLRQFTKSNSEVLKRVYDKKTRIVLIYGDTDLPYKSPKELTDILEMEEKEMYEEWGKMVGLNYEEVPEV